MPFITLGQAWPTNRSSLLISQMGYEVSHRGPSIKLVSTWWLGEVKIGSKRGGVIGKEGS